MSEQKSRLVKSNDKDWLEKAMKELDEENKISNTKAVIIVTLIFVIGQFYIVPLSVIAWQWWFSHS